MSLPCLNLQVGKNWIMFTVGNVDRYIGRHSIDTRSPLGRSILNRHSVATWSIDTQSTLGRHSVVCRSPVDRHSIATLSIVDQQSVDSWSTYLFRSPILRCQFADSQPTLDRHFADNRHNQPTHYWRSCDLKWVLIKTNTFCFALRISSLKCRTFCRRLRKQL